MEKRTQEINIEEAMKMIKPKVTASTAFGLFVGKLIAWTIGIGFLVGMTLLILVFVKWGWTTLIK